MDNTDEGFYMPEIKLVCAGLWSVTTQKRGTHYFRSNTMARLWIIDPDNPVFKGGW